MGEGAGVVIANVDGDVADVLNDGSVERVAVDAKISRDRNDDLGDKVVGAIYHEEALSAAETYAILIDLDDGGSGDYLHVGSSSIKAVAIRSVLVKSNIGHQWKSIIGVISIIDGTSATVLWLESAALFGLDTSKVEQSKESFSSLPIDLSVAGGVFTTRLGGHIQTGITAVNTGITLNNVIGNPKTPAVGDMLVRVERLSGAGTVHSHYEISYFVD